jgi:protocatechuate 3,4-dioxygenase beta subunit
MNVRLLAGVGVALALLVAGAASERARAQGSGVTPDVGQGPNHRAGAPFRGKLSPPFAEGTTLVIRGHVRDAKTGEGVSGAVLDAFHAADDGRYDMDGFAYRGRVMTDERGYYEFETIRPSGYGPAPHIHMLVSADGYRDLSTEIQFEDGDRDTNPTLTPELVEKTVGPHTYLEGTFDITLRPRT